MRALLSAFVRNGRSTVCSAVVFVAPSAAVYRLSAKLGVHSRQRRRGVVLVVEFRRPQDGFDEIESGIVGIGVVDRGPVSDLTLAGVTAQILDVGAIDRAVVRRRHGRRSGRAEAIEAGRIENGGDLLGGDRAGVELVDPVGYLSLTDV